MNQLQLHDGEMLNLKMADKKQFLRQLTINIRSYGLFTQIGYVHQALELMNVHSPDPSDILDGRERFIGPLGVRLSEQELLQISMRRPKGGKGHSAYNQHKQTHWDKLAQTEQIINTGLTTHSKLWYETS